MYFNLNAVKTLNKKKYPKILNYFILTIKNQILFFHHFKID